MHPRQVRQSLAITMFLLAAAVSVTTFLQAADQPINLDENSANGAESKVSTKVLQTYPVRIENTVYNNAAGEAFTFKWPGAGPGGFASFVSAGPGVGTIWTWSTVYQVYSIDSPVTFSPVRSMPVFGAPAGGVLTSPSSDGSFTAPGKSINPGQVTLSSASLSASLITFFSPEKTVASCGVDCSDGNCEIFLENQTGESVTVKNRQQDCCLEPHQLICEGECKSYLTDPLNCGGCGNVCASDEFCSEGACEEICPGQTLCGEVCIDTTSDPLNCGSCGNACGADEHCSEGACQPNCDKTVCGTQCIDTSSDPLNCGACGNVCPANNVCTNGACIRCRAPKPTACNNKCTSLHTDPFNCGSCGNVCDFTSCPSTGQGTCSQGSSCVCSPGASATSEQTTFSPTPSIFPEPMSPMARSRVASRSSAERWKTGVTGGVTGGVAAASVHEAPVCDIAPIAQVIPNGGRFTQSQAEARFGKEIHTTLTIVKNGETVAQGPCALIVPVTDVDTSGVILSADEVVTRDESGDNLCQPGEAWCNYYITVRDVGDAGCLNPLATLSSPPDQFNLNQLTFLNATAPYPDLPGYPGDGQPIESKTNSVAFSITAPQEQAEDVGRRFLMTVSCANLPEPVVMPLTLGIGDACDPANLSGEAYDRLNGFLAPVKAALVQSGPINYSTGTYNHGSTIPFKLSLGCGARVLTDAEITPNPQVASLVHATLGPQPLIGINGQNNANPDDPSFSCSATGCDYQFRTEVLPVGTYVIGIKMPDSRVFKAGFTISP